LKQYPTPDKLSRAQTGKLIEVLQTASNGRFREWKARQLKELAKDSFGIPDCEKAYSTLILLYLNQLQSLQDDADSLERRIEELFTQFNSTLTTISGRGAVILSEIRDISRFASADKLAAYAGLNPKVKQFGETKSSAVHMSKRGSPYLRRAIWMADAIAVQHDPIFRSLLREERI